MLKHLSFFENMEGHPIFEFMDSQMAAFLEKNGFIFTNFNYPDDNGPMVSRIVLSAYHDIEDVQRLGHVLNQYMGQ